MLPIYSRVRLLTDRFNSEGAKRGDLGFVIETYDEETYEVEFSDEKGVTVAQVVARGSELEVCEPAEMDTGEGWDRA